MFEAFILAGGKSARLQREKALVELNGDNLVSRAVRVVQSSGAAKTTLLAGTKGKSLSAYFPDLDVENDFSPGLGASGGLFTALKESGAEYVFVLACDLPLVTSELISFLAKRFEESEADACVPMQPDTLKQPLCAFYRKSSCIVPFQAEILRSELTPSVRDLLNKVNTEYVEFEDLAALKGSENFFLNINTPLDLEAAREIVKDQ